MFLDDARAVADRHTKLDRAIGLAGRRRAANSAFLGRPRFFFGAGAASAAFGGRPRFFGGGASSSLNDGARQPPIRAACVSCFWCRQCSICRLGKPGRRCLRRWALARALAGVGGAATRVSYAFTSSEWRAQEMFSARSLRICDASQASPCASERSPSGPTGLETNVSASVPLLKKTRVLKHNPSEDDCSHNHHSYSEAWRALCSEPNACCQVTRFAPLYLSLHLHWAAAVLIMARVA